MMRSLRTLATVFSAVCALTVLGILVLAAIAVSTGIITRERVATVGAVFRGATVQDPAEIEALRERAAHVTDFEEANWDLVLARRRLVEDDERLRYRNDALAGREAEVSSVLDRDRARLATLREQLEADRRSYEEERRAEVARIQEEGFQRNLRMIARVDPAEAYGILRGLPDDEVVRYLRNLRERASAAILAEWVRREQPDLDPMGGMGGPADENAAPGPGPRIARILALLERARGAETEPLAQ